MLPRRRANKPAEVRKIADFCRKSKEHNAYCTVTAMRWVQEKIVDVDSSIKSRAIWRGFLSFMMHFKFCRLSGKTSQRSATADNAQQDDDDGDHQQDMNESAYGVRADQTDQPQDHEYDCNGIEHGNFLSGF